jgi:hypothetical protein
MLREVPFGLILLGAGSSVPFGIPAMKKFVENFKEKIADKPSLLRLFVGIDSALKNSKELVGYNVDFDLESLMVVLQDLASDINRPISLPTFAFMLISITKNKEFAKEINVKLLRDSFGQEAKQLLETLQCFIFDMCFEPIRKGQKDTSSFTFLNLFYEPLFTLIDEEIVMGRSSWIFTTNWDLCLKQWLEYSQISFEDGTGLDKHKKAVLNPTNGWTDDSVLLGGGVRVVPLHGSFDLVNCRRFASGREYSEIQ